MKSGKRASCVLKYVLSNCTCSDSRFWLVFIVQSIIKEVGPKFAHIFCSQVVKATLTGNDIYIYSV